MFVLSSIKPLHCCIVQGIPPEVHNPIQRSPFPVRTNEVRLKANLHSFLSVDHHQRSFLSFFPSISTSIIHLQHQRYHNGNMVVKAKIATFEQAAANASDPRLMACRLSEKSDRKKYAFADGLRSDLQRTRAALKSCCASTSHNDGTATRSCTFGALYDFTEGRIANLNKILQNLKKANEVCFEPECFFDGIHNDKVIELLDGFWKEEYTVNERNVFRVVGRAALKDTPPDERRGRSYFEENERTRNVHNCSICMQRVAEEDRITVRACVYHMKCISCVICGACPRHKADYLTFDGQICCGVACIRQYDAAHLLQEREWT